MHTKFWFENLRQRYTTWKRRHRGDDNIKMGFKEIGLNDVNLIHYTLITHCDSKKESNRILDEGQAVVFISDAQYRILPAFFQHPKITEDFAWVWIMYDVR